MIIPHFYFKHHNQVNLTIHAKILCFINKYCCLFVTVVHKMTIYRFKRLYPLEILMYDLVQMHKDIYMYLLWGLFIVSFKKLNWYCLYVFWISFFYYLLLLVLFLHFVGCIAGFINLITRNSLWGEPTIVEQKS